MRQILFIVGLMCLLANLVYANPLKSPKSWSGNVQFGYTGTGGNAEDNNISSKLNLNYKRDKWSHSYKVSALYSNSKQKVTAERYEGNFEWNYNFEKNLFAFVHNDSFYDAFNPYDLSVSSSLGIGVRLINATSFTWDIQGGPGFRYARVDNSSDYEREITGYSRTTANWTISKAASLQENLSVDTGPDNTFTKSESALSMDIVGNLGLQVSYTISHNSTIPKNSSKTKKTDYRTDVTLLFSF